jgi:Zn-dependent protease
VLFGFTPSWLIAVAIIVLIAAPVHEFSHALAAYRLGDGTAKMMGRLTLNPIAHFDPIGGLMLLLIGFGRAKPTPVNPYNLAYGRYGEAIVAFAGPASNLVLAAAFALPLRYILTTGMDVPTQLTDVLKFLVLINVSLFVLNLLPIPPLDGSKILFAFLNPRTTYQWRPVLEQYGIFILLIVAFVPIGGGGSLLFEIYRLVMFPIVDFLVGHPIF